MLAFTSLKPIFIQKLPVFPQIGLTIFKLNKIRYQKYQLSLAAPIRQDSNYIESFKQAQNIEALVWSIYAFTGS